MLSCSGSVDRHLQALAQAEVSLSWEMIDPPRQSVADLILPRDSRSRHMAQGILQYKGRGLPSLYSAYFAFSYHQNQSLFLKPSSVAQQSTTQL